MKWYKCTNCGHPFQEDEVFVEEERHYLDGHYAGSQFFASCPKCRGNYEDASYCDECEGVFFSDEVYNGWCEKCLRETIDYDTFFEYCEANKDEQYLDTFVMCEILNCEYVPKFSSYEFHQLMIERYNVEVECAKQNEKLFGFLPACIRFIMEDDGANGRENYADWLNKREVK